MAGFVAFSRTAAQPENRERTQNYVLSQRIGFTSRGFRSRRCTLHLRPKLTRATGELPAAADRAIAREAALARKSTERQVEGVRKDLTGQTSGIRSDLFKRVDALDSTAAGQLDLS
jgi:hypothetical protein